MLLKVRLAHSVNNSNVEATIVKLSSKHVEDFRNVWMNLLREFKQDDKFWDLMIKFRMIENNNNYEVFDHRSSKSC